MSYDTLVKTSFRLTFIFLALTAISLFVCPNVTGYFALVSLIGYIACLFLIFNAS